MIDELEHVVTGFMDVGAIFHVTFVADGAEGFRTHHFGEADNGIQRCAPFMGNVVEELCFRDVGVFSNFPLAFKLGG